MPMRSLQDRKGTYHHARALPIIIVIREPKQRAPLSLPRSGTRRNAGTHYTQHMSAGRT